MTQSLYLKCKDHIDNLKEVFQIFLSAEAMVDVTLVCDGLSIKAHKIILSAFSPFFQSLFLENPCKHPLVILKDMKYTDLKTIIDFMYHGAVNVAHEDIASLIKAAKCLKVKGLSDVIIEKHQSDDESPDSKSNAPSLTKRKHKTLTRCLKLNDYMDNLIEVFQKFLSAEAMVDVTLACDGLSLKAHKIVLSAYSPLFQSFFLENHCEHPIVILKGMKYTDLQTIIDFMYHGAINVAHEDIASLIKAAKTLKVKGLSDVTINKHQSDDESPDSWTTTLSPKRRKCGTQKTPICNQNVEEILQGKSRHTDYDVDGLSRKPDSDVEELPRQPDSDIDESPEHSDSDIVDLTGKPESDIEELPGQPNSDIEELTGHLDFETEELPIQPDSDIEELYKPTNSDTDQLPGHSDSNIEKLPSDTCYDILSPTMHSLSSHKLQQVSDKKEHYVEETFEEEETKFFPEFEILLRQTLTKEDSAGTSVQSKELVDNFLPEAAVLLRQTSTEAELLKTTIQCDVEELSTHSDSHVDESVQSDMEQQQQPQSSTNRSTIVVTSSPFSGTSAPKLTDPSVEDQGTGSSIARSRRKRTVGRPSSYCFCDKTFSCNDQYNSQMRTHQSKRKLAVRTGKKPVCEICNKGFSGKIKLK